MKLLRKIKFYHLTGKVMDPKVKKVIKMFDDICNNLEECYSNDYPKSIFYKYNEKVYFELDLKNDVTRCRYDDFWLKFQTKFGLNDVEIKELTQYMLGTYLKRGVPPTHRWKYPLPITIMVGNLLKKRGTPNISPEA